MRIKDQTISVIMILVNDGIIEGEKWGYSSMTLATGKETKNLARRNKKFKFQKIHF